MPATIYTKAKIDALLSPPPVNALTLHNDWTNFDAATYGPLRYSRDHAGMVRVNGLIRLTGTSWEFATLPVGCRPTYSIPFATFAADVQAQITVRPNGDLSCGGGSINNAKSWLLVNLSFQAA